MELFPSVFTNNGFPKGDNFAFPEISQKLWHETDKGYETAVDLPGVEKEEIEAKLSDGMIEISAKNDHRNYYKKFTVPREGDVENIEATYKNGTLQLVIPKTRASATTKSIPVK